MSDYRNNNELFDFRNELFQKFVFNSNTIIYRLFETINQFNEKFVDVKFTIFHRYLDELFKEGKIMHHYTQNIDCLEQYCQHLQEIITQLHDRTNILRCELCDERFF